MNTSDYSEDALVEQPAIELFRALGWETANCFHEFDYGKSPLGRETEGDVVLVRRLRAALEELNPTLPSEAIHQAIEELTHGRSTMSAAAANREVYRLLKDGVKVTFKGDEGEDVSDTVKVIDWNTPANNNFFLASQFWIVGEMYRRRADLIGFVNGLPLVFIELKASHKAVQTAFREELARLPRHDSTGLLVQRVHHSLQWKRKPDWQHDGGVGALRGVETHQQRANRVKELLQKLSAEKLVLDWRKRQQTRAAVRVCIEETLDQLPRVYTPELFQQKCDLTYQHVYDSYFGSGGSIYQTRA